MLLVPIEEIKFGDSCCGSNPQYIMLWLLIHSGIFKFWRASAPNDEYEFYTENTKYILSGRDLMWFTIHNRISLSDIIHGNLGGENHFWISAKKHNDHELTSKILTIMTQQKCL